MRIGLVTHLPLWPFSGGSSFRVYRYVKEMCDKGHKVYAIAPLDKSVSAQEVKKQFGPNLTFYPFKLFEVSRFAKSREMRYIFFSMLATAMAIKMHRKNRLDVIIAHNSICALPAIALKKLYRVPYVLDIVDIVSGYAERMSTSRARNIMFKTLFNLVFFKIEKKFAGMADRVIAITPQLAEKLGIDNFAEVHDGVDLKRFNPKTSSKEICRKLKLENKKVVIFVSVLDPCQNPEIIVKAAEYVIKKVPDIRFVMVGKGTSVPFLKKVVREKNLQDCFIFTGWIPAEKLPSYLAASDIGLVTHPKNISGEVMFPIKLSEYWAMEKPAIVSDLPQLRDVVKDYKNGFLFDSGSERDLAEKIVLAFKLNSGKLRGMGKNGRKIVEKNYDWDKVSGQFVKEIEKLTKFKRQKGIGV